MTMDKIREIVTKWILQAKENDLTDGTVDIDGLLKDLEELCVDLNSKEDYPTRCVYCGRPAATKYG